MANFFGGIGNAIKSGAQTAVGIAPYASRLLAQRQAQDEADQQRALLQMYQANSDRRAQQATDLAQRVGNANIDRIGAQTTKLQEPIPSAVKYQTDDQGNVVGLPAKLPPGQAITPMSTGVKAQIKPLPSEPLVKTAGANGSAVLTPRSKAAGMTAAAVEQPGDKTLVQTEGPDGNPVWTPRSQAAGMQAKTTTRVESATNTAAAARLQAAVSEMNNAHANMSEFEHKLSTGQVHISAGAQVLQRVANAFTHEDPVSQLTQSGALSALNATDPELARYIRRGLSFAEGESMVSQRPSDFRTKMAAFLSTAGSNASPEMIADIAGRRTSILNPLNSTVGTPKPAKGGGHGGAPGTLPPNVAHPANKGDTPGNISLGGAGGANEQQRRDYDAAAAHLKAQGKDPVAEIGPRP